ncbi:transglycosylase SLT domain-containing protein [Treponema sp. OMZ 788]|uniref:flagellar assembly lytic transglycosylase n=1 Tax=Treponema sp. OMZ 788 TaxID=2563664 RepID=UPI0020A5446E|nr:lytic transglycosylase domain-containing protein [Treponema sp. OMZ 788]UTC65028.1 transglycosylase SLT domain-containing protein [Treponema sp. OMZ 788]
MSCAGSYDKAEEAELIDALYSENFYRFLKPQPLELKKLYNTDPSSLYYIGLALQKARVRSADKKIYDESARAYFEYAIKNSPMPYKKLADDELYSLLSNEEKIKRLEEKLALPEALRLDAKNDKDIRAAIQKLLFLSGNFNKMEQPLPDYLNAQKFDSELIEGLKNIEKNKSELKVYGNNFFRILTARKLTFESRFKDAWPIFKDLMEAGEEALFEHRTVLSDAGRAALSGSVDYAADAVLFEKRLEFYEQRSNKTSDYIVQKYMYAFYAARMRLKMGGKENTEKAVLLFKKAKSYPPQAYDYDVALWYILDIEKNRSFKVFLDELCFTAPSWKNMPVYEELTAHACMKLVLAKDWNGLERLQKAVQKTNLFSDHARHAYILARSKKLPADESKKLYREAYEKDHASFYYRLMAAYQLGLPIVSSPYGKNYKRKGGGGFSDEDTVKILKGFVKYKLYSQLYNKITVLYPQITTEEASFFSKILSENGYYADSMRTMSFAVNSEGADFGEEHLKLIYPRPWLDSVKRYSAEYNLPEYLLYALLRSESYFKSEVISHAGAIGLAQLMKPTAADIARRLKIDSYDLNNPDTNIRFGAFYLSEMIRRNGGKIMHALFSYNAGPNAVKRWVRQAGDLPTDLFLESLAYAETRGYGRNVLAAAIIYGHLYYGKNYREIIKELFPDIK